MRRDWDTDISGAASPKASEVLGRRTSAARNGYSGIQTDDCQMNGREYEHLVQSNLGITGGIKVRPSYPLEFTSITPSRIVLEPLQLLLIADHPGRRLMVRTDSFLSTTAFRCVTSLGRCREGKVQNRVRVARWLRRGFLVARWKGVGHEKASACILIRDEIAGTATLGE